MHAKHFDELTRKFADRSSRRVFIKMAAAGIGIAAGSGAVSFHPVSAAQQCGELGSTCRTDADCCAEWQCATSGTCGIVDTPCAPAGGDCESDTDCCPGMACTSSQTCGFQDGAETNIETLPNTGSGGHSGSRDTPALLGAAGVLIGAVGLLGTRWNRNESDATG